MGPRQLALGRWAALPRLGSAPAAALVGVGGGDDSSGGGCGCRAGLSEPRASRGRGGSGIAAPSSGVSRRAEVRPILQSEPRPDLGRLLCQAPAALSGRRGSARPRQRPAPPAPARGTVPGRSQLRDPGRRGWDALSSRPDPVHWDGKLLAHRTGPWLRACAQPFYIVCVGAPRLPSETRVEAGAHSPPTECKGARSPQPLAPRPEPSAAFRPVLRTWDRTNAQEAPARVQHPVRGPKRAGSRTEPDRAGAVSRSCHLSAAAGEGLSACPEEGNTGHPPPQPPRPGGGREPRSAAVPRKGQHHLRGRDILRSRPAHSLCYLLPGPARGLHGCLRAGRQGRAQEHGIYGCRWKRYQRSHDDTTPWERLWFLLLTFTFGLTLTWLYFWWEVHNDYDEFNWYLYNRLGYWSDWSVPILITTAAAFTYIAGLLVLALCHIAVGQQMNLHWLHKMGLMVILVATVVAMSAVAQLWEDEWEVLLISLQGTAPFLHVGALAAITALSWIVAGQFARAERSSSQMAILCIFFAMVFAFYLAPLTISSPCIMEKKDLGPKPALIGHRGAPMLAPEHTLMSFRKALEQKLYGLQADVTISLDGVPFLMHDTTLRRTTNVEEEFPELARRPASMLNWTILQRLNAGQWFLKTDPFWTASSLSPSDHREAQNQSICSLAELLELAKGNATLLLNLRDPPQEHPYRGSFLNVTLEALLRSGFPQHQVMWLPNRQRPFVRKVAPGFQQTSGSKEAAASLRKGHIQRLNLRYTQVSRQELRDYASWNLSVNLYTVNAPWLFSLLWCAGVPSVTSDNSHTLSQVPSPLWIMPPDEYCLMWVTADLISFSLIIGIFVLQKWRLGGIRSYNPEQIMLSAAVRRTSRDVSIMKEKLIFSEISDGMEVSDELSVCSDNSYDMYANSAPAPKDNRGSGSRTKTHADRSGR